MAESILKVKNFAVTLDGEVILQPLSFEVSEGAVAAIIGPNGAGKSVLLRALVGLLPYEGEIAWRSDVKIGYVPQRFQIDRTLPMTVREFFLLHEAKFLLSGGGAEERISSALQEVGLSKDVAGERLSTLSGGQMQRILVAWALFDKPNVLLFDEPTTGIDIGGEQTIYNLLHSLQDLHGITIILVSHELNIVFQYATSVLCINRALICAGEPHETLTPEQLKKLYGEGTFYHHMHTEGELKASH